MTVHSGHYHGRRWLQLLSLFMMISTSLIAAFQPISTKHQLQHQRTDKRIVALPTTITKYEYSSQPSRSYTQLHNSWNSEDINGPDKLKACVPYMLPLLDGDIFGKYIYQRVPPLGLLDDLLLAPLVSIFQSFPFLGLILFLLLSLGTRNVDGMSRAVRFNAQQAVLIDIALIFPTLIGEGLDGVGVPRMYEEIGNNLVYYFLMTSIVYSVVMNLRGRKPNGIPYISDAADYITGPF
mmetsp:Transcript_21281/g.31958  ORF Transcript_21281/g.31958 Transcript_21281/m.31958 type:complete len:237 (+) Transcript_21281:143-853(+)